ncbi:MAG: NAD(P)H-binding protein [Rhodospirillaceae bacterium]|nr:NAD(P)H-binding protein [Rhodospirillaceae bacterium]
MRILIAIVLGFFALTTVARAADGGVLVLGGTGQLGSEIVKVLAAAGEDVSVLVRPTSDRARLAGIAVTYVTGDMVADADMERVFKGTKYRAVIDASSAAFSGSQDFYEKSQLIVSKWAAATGVGQLILHGAIGAGDSASLINVEKAFPVQRQAIASKTVAEEILIGSGVPYTIIRHLTLLPMEVKESGRARLSKDRTAVGAITRDGLARLTRECLGNPDCLNVVFHAVDDEVELSDRVLDSWRNVIKPAYLPARAAVQR